METRLIRHEAWPGLLAEFIQGAEKRPFLWGEFDCCLFAADWVLACTGVDVAIELRGKYKSGTGAARVIKKYGGIERMVDDLLAPYGVIKPPITKARRGDVCLLDTPLGDALGVCCGERIACATFNGVAMASLRSARAVWMIA